MSLVFYYSNFCNSCRNILPEIAKFKLNNQLHFICIDDRIQKPDGKLYVILSNQKEIPLPDTVNKVPALMLLSRGSQVIFGNQIISYLNTTLNEKNVSVNDDPETFNFGDINSYGVISDNYSFLDQSVESLGAKGDGGLRQLRNNVKLNHSDYIETPPDNYTPNKVDMQSIKKFEGERNAELN
jgi:hypothetical protein